MPIVPRQRDGATSAIPLPRTQLFQIDDQALCGLFFRLRRTPHARSLSTRQGRLKLDKKQLKPSFPFSNLSTIA